MPITSTTRSGSLHTVFDGGRSELLNHIARLSVVYEDFRLELDGLVNAIPGVKKRIRQSDAGFRFLYYERRTLASLMEYKGGLAQVTSLPEYKIAKRSLSRRLLNDIESANQYLQKHSKRIADFRNALGGHVQQKVVDFAVASLHANTGGSITWTAPKRRKKTSVLSLQLGFAVEIVGQAIQYFVQDQQKAQEEIQAALDEIMGAYPKVQAATFALVRAFLWDRFGK